MDDLFDKAYNELKAHIDKLRGKFIQRYLDDRTSSPEEFDLDVKAYCVLCHAAFEDFFEIVAQYVLDKSIKNFKIGKSNRAIITLMHFKAKPIDLLHDKTDEIIKSFDYIKDQLESIKGDFSEYIEEKNHGIKLKNLNNLLTPLSLNIKSDTKYLESLDKLSSERGRYAHKVQKRRALIKSIAPEDCDDLIIDCLEICSDLRDKAKKLIE